MKTITKQFTITATVDAMVRFEHFMCFLHYNGGHSGLFGMCFDGDGHERFKCDPPPDRIGSAHHHINCGQELELARERCFESFALDRSKHHYVADGKQLVKVMPDGTEEVRKRYGEDGLAL